MTLPLPRIFLTIKQAMDLGGSVRCELDTLPLPRIFLTICSVCVCVSSSVPKSDSQHGFEAIQHSRGPGTYDCLSWPTKTRQHRGENVPAFFELLPKLSHLSCLVPSCSCG